MSHKRLYVVSSLHLSLDREEIINSRLEEILEVRLRFIEALALRLRRGSYFSDGLYSYAANGLNRAVEEATLRAIRDSNRDDYNEGGEGFMRYEFGKVIELFKRLRKRDVRFVLKPTEMEEGIFTRDIEVRDRDIIGHAHLYGSRENILFVGLAHELKSLENSGFKSYRTNIASFVDCILGVGKLPKHLEHLTGLPRKTKSGLDVVWSIDYI